MRSLLNRRAHELIFSGILILGFLLRAQETISHNFLFLLDQGRDMMAVKQIVYGHHLTLIGPYTSLGGVFQGPLWYYLLTIPTFIFQGDPWGAVLFMLIISMSVLIVVYVGVKKYIGVPAGLFTAFLFAVSPEASAAATFAWNPHPMWLIIPIYILIMYVTVYKNEKFQIYLWPVIALSFHFQTAMGVFLLASTFIYFVLCDKKILNSRYLFYGLFLACIFGLPQIAFEFRHNFLMTRSILTLFSGNSLGLFAGNENHGYWPLMASHAYELLVHFKSAFLHDSVSLLLPLAFLLLIIYNIYKQNLENRQRQFVSLCIALTLIVQVLALVYPFPLRSWFLTGFQGYYILVVGVLLGSLWNTKTGKIFVLGMLIVSSFTLMQRLDMLYMHPPDDGGVAKIKGKLGAVDAIYADAKGKEFNVVVFTPPVNTDPYDYLFWLRSKQYMYMPGTDKKGLVYLLIEPDPSAPWSYKGWLETVVIEGSILQTTVYPSGFIVQKRLFEDSHRIQL